MDLAKEMGILNQRSRQHKKSNVDTTRERSQMMYKESAVCQTTPRSSHLLKCDKQHVTEGNRRYIVVVRVQEDVTSARYFLSLVVLSTGLTLVLPSSGGM